MVNCILGFLLLLTLYYSWYFVRDLYSTRGAWGTGSWHINFLIGWITNFLDTLGIGSFATTTMALNVTKQMPNDKLLPGTLLVADTIPVMLEAFIFIVSVEVESVTLCALLLAAISGAKLGAKFVPRLPERKVQLYLGCALLITAVFMAGKQLGLMTFLGTGNMAVELTGWRLFVGIIGNFVLGGLMTVGCGLYAPCMAMVYLLGLSPKIAFPVMMGSCAALMPVAATEFIVAGDYARKNSVAILLGGIAGVYIAAKYVIGMDINLLIWLVISVVTYTGCIYIKKSKKKN